MKFLFNQTCHHQETEGLGHPSNNGSTLTTRWHFTLEVNLVTVLPETIQEGLFLDFEIEPEYFKCSCYRWDNSDKCKIIILSGYLFI